MTKNFTEKLDSRAEKYLPEEIKDFFIDSLTPTTLSACTRQNCAFIFDKVADNNLQPQEALFKLCQLEPIDSYDVNQWFCVTLLNFLNDSILSSTQWFAKDTFGSNVWHYLSKSGNQVALEVLYDFARKNNILCDFDCYDEEQQTALLLAVENNHEHIVQWLVEHHAPVEQGDEAGDTPLHRAAAKGFLDIVKYLVQHVKDINKKNNYSENPLYHAAAFKHFGIVRLLLKNGAVSMPSVTQKTSLHWATKAERLSIVMLLLKHGADINAKDDLGFTPLFEAVNTKNSNLVQLLLNKGADLNHITNGGRNALHYGVLSKNVAMVKLLLEKGINACLIDNDKCSALDYAQQEGCKEMVTTLRQAQEKQLKNY